MADLPATLPTELVPLTFLVGRWERGGHAEHWVAVGDVLYGLALGPDGRFEVLTVERAGEQVRYVAQPGGEAKTAFALIQRDNGQAEFTHPGHEPERIFYSLQGDKRLLAQADELAWKLKLRPPVPAPELEQADRVFAEAVASSGVEAWVAAFDPQGHQWDEQAARRITPGPDMKAYMGPVLEGRLQWDPLYSGLSPDGQLGWTAGTSTWTAPGEPEPAMRGAYVTVWRKQDDGSWKIWFDAGNPIEGP
jgi:hypothetical protein